MTWGKAWEAAVDRRGQKYAQRDGYEWNRVEPPTVQIGLKLRHTKSNGAADYELRRPGPDIIPELKEQGNHYGQIGLSSFLKRKQAVYLDTAVADGKIACVLYRWVSDRGNRVYLLDWRDIRGRVWTYLMATEVRQDMMRAFKMGIKGISKPDTLEPGTASMALDEIESLARGEWRDTGDECPDWLSVYE